MKAPENIWKLAQARADARALKNFTLGDQIRDEIASAGWEVVDIGRTFEIREKSKYLTYKNIQDIKPLLDGQIALAMIITGFSEDAVTTIATVRRFSQVPIVVLCIGEVGALGDVCEVNVVVIHIEAACGWGDATNALLEKISSRFLIIMDPSTRFTGDATALAKEELLRGDFAAVGWRGGLINLEDQWRSVDDKGNGEVDVLFSYFIALDRQRAIDAGAFSPRAIYYRNADIEFSLKLRQAGERLLQMDLPLEQDRHHGYHDTDPQLREVQSKKNYDRILETFRGKNAILSPRR